jgi:hypothetical protein
MNHVTRYALDVTRPGRDTLRDRSYAIFGNRYVVEVVAAIAATSKPRARFTVRMIAARTELTDSLVKLVTQRLVNAQLLRRLPQDRPRAPAYHEVQRSGGKWDALVDLCARLAKNAPRS